MKKFNILALIALSLAAIGNVGTVHADIAGDIASINGALPGLQTALDTAQVAYDAAVSTYNSDLAAIATYAAIADPSAAQITALANARSLAITSKGTMDAAKTTLTTSTTALNSGIKAVSDFATTQPAVTTAAANAAATAAANKVSPAVAKKSAPKGTTAQGTMVVQKAQTLASGFTGATNTVSKNQLKAITTLAKPTTNAVAQTIAASKMPITATGSISAKTSANAKSKIDGSAFTQGAQINQTTDSVVQGSNNTQGAARAASSNNAVANYSGANLVGINKALTGTPKAAGTLSVAKQKGIIAQGISGAMNMLDSDTKNLGGLQITGGKGAAATNIGNGTGGLGNLTNVTRLGTTGATNYTGDVTGSQNSTTFSGSEFNSNT